MNIENKAAVFNILGPIILNGINFFTIPIFTRLLGPAQYGIVAVYTTWVGIFSIIMGLQVQGSIGTAMVYFKKGEMKSYLSSILLMGLLFSALCLLLGIAFSQQLKELLLLDAEELRLLGIQSVGSFVIAFSGIAFIFAKNAKMNFCVNVLTAVFTTVLSLLFIVFYFSPERFYLGRMYGMAAPITMMGGGLAVYFVKEGHVSFNVKYAKFCLPICIPLIFHGLSQIILGQSDRIMLQHMMGNGPTGIYSFVITFSGVLMAIYGALNNTWVPFYYDDLKAGALAKISLRTKNYIFIYTIMVIVFALWSPEVIKLFVPEPFWPAIRLLPLFIFGNYFNFLYSFPVNFEFFHKTTYTIAIGTICAAVVNIGVNYLLIPHFGMWGAAFGTLFAHILLFVFHEIISAFILPFHYHYSIKDFLPGIFVTTIALVLADCLKDFIVIRWGAGFVLAGIWCYSIYKRKSLF